MAGKTLLLNTSQRVGDLSQLVGEWFVVAQATGRIPLPWLCLFAPADLLACQLTFMESSQVDGEERHSPRKFGILNPALSVREAKANLARARPLFERLAGDAEVGARRWRDAMASLEELPLAFLTIDPTRFLLSADLAASAAAYVSAFSNEHDGVAAKRAAARLDPDASAAENFDGLDGGFLEAGRALRRKRSPEEARELQARMTTFETATTAEARPRVEPTPPPAPAPAPGPAGPPPAFWSDERLLQHGRGLATVDIGATMFMGMRRYYSLRLTNRSSRPIRVREFAAFGRSGADWQIATSNSQWFSAETFINWYQAPSDGWIAPGQTLTHLSFSAGDQEEGWAFWCEDGLRAPFMATAQVGQSSTGGRMNGEGWALGVHVAELAPDTALVRAELDELVEQLVTMSRESMGHALTRDLAGLRWLDETLEAMHRSGDRSRWGELVPMFGAFVGDVILGPGPGAWVRCDEILCVQAAGATFFPFQKVIKRLMAGRGRDTSILGIALGEGAVERVPVIPGQIRPIAPDAALATALQNLRSAMAQRRGTMHPLTLAGIAGKRPAWMKPDDGLREAVGRQGLLLAEGTIVWAALVQANKLLFKPGPEDCPAQVVYSRDPDLDARPLELRAIAQRIYKLKGATPSDPREKAIAERVTNEMDRTMGWRLPVEVTPRAVFSAAIMIYRKHVPGGVLSGASFPLLVHPDTQAVMMVPVEFWPIDMVQLWKDGVL